MLYSDGSTPLADWYCTCCCFSVDTFLASISFNICHAIVLFASQLDLQAASLSAIPHNSAQWSTKELYACAVSIMTMAASCKAIFTTARVFETSSGKCSNKRHDERVWQYRQEEEFGAIWSGVTGRMLWSKRDTKAMDDAAY